MRIPFLAAVIFLSVSVGFGWQAVQVSTTPSAPSPIMTEAARLVAEGDERFPTNLNALRTALTAADPDTSLRPKSWAALSQVIAVRDELAKTPVGEPGKGKPVSVSAPSPQLQAAMQNLLVACSTEDSLTATSRARREGLAAMLAVAALAAVAAVGCVVAALFESRLAKALIAAGSAPKGLTLAAQIGYVLQELERAKQERAAQERHSLEQALALRRERRERNVEKPAPEPPTPAPQPTPPAPPPPRGPRRLDELGESSDKLVSFPKTPDEPEGFIFEKSQAALMPLEVDLDPAPAPAVVSNNSGRLNLAGVSSVLQLRQSGCEVVAISIEDVDLFHHQYNQPEKVLDAALGHIVSLLLGNKVTAEELAVEHDTVYWALPEDAIISEPQIELFVRELYQDSVLQFQGKRINLPHIKISVAPAARKVIKPAC
ncbi:MAG: hypothetical protein K1Y36_20725 [Blastocatellia bacterium]|nr:hypothetical protein [Blastocatellia bacterium]